MAEEKKSFFARLREGLTKTRNNIVKGFDSVFSGYSVIDDEFYEELEETMIMGDLGGRATEEILDRLKEQVNDQGICDPQDCREILIDSIREQMHVGKTAYDFEKEQSVVMVIGVNGVGKTTSIGKLASKLKKQGRKVLIAAADTFRAAAIDQLAVWCDRAGVELIRQNEGADPASVVYDAIAAANKQRADVLIIDTAGRLHNKSNLMNELAKINRIITRELPDAARETLLVLDSTTGQNAVIQAKKFKETADITGLILTKLDGTAKGGAVFSIKDEIDIPVKFIGVGEKIDDMQPFDAKMFVDALMQEDEKDKGESENNTSEEENDD